MIVERNSPVIDKQSTAIAATFDSRQLADLPSARSMWAIQAATPAVYVARFDLGASAAGLGGPISAYGTAGFNRPMVEGISVTGINPTGFTLDYGAFDEVSVTRLHTVRSGIRRVCTCSSSANPEETSIAARSMRTSATETGSRSTSTKDRSAVARRAAAGCRRAMSTGCRATTTSTPMSAATSNPTRSGGISRFARSRSPRVR